MRRLLVLPLAAVVLVVAGCGGGGDSSSTSTPAAAAAPTGTAVEIDMKDLMFSPKDVKVKVGTTVTWKNTEAIPHNVTADSGASFKSDTFGEGKTFVYKTTKDGTIKYECTIHPGMVGTITVEG